MSGGGGAGPRRVWRAGPAGRARVSGRGRAPQGSPGRPRPSLPRRPGPPSAGGGLRGEELTAAGAPAGLRGPREGFRGVTAGLAPPRRWSPRRGARGVQPARCARVAARVDLGLQTSSCPGGEDGATERRGMGKLIERGRCPVVRCCLGKGVRVRRISVPLGIKAALPVEPGSSCTALRGHSPCERVPVCIFPSWPVRALVLTLLRVWYSAQSNCQVEFGKVENQFKILAVFVSKVERSIPGGYRYTR